MKMLHKLPLGKARNRQSDKVRYDIKRSKVQMKEDTGVSSMVGKRRKEKVL
jgi:hypothetical protein